MAETYCGKSCDVCNDKTELNCPGCRVGLGNAISGDCEISRCCRGKGHEHCGTCTINGHCGILRGRHGMAQYRRRKLEAERVHKEHLSRDTVLLGKWLFVMFELVIVGVIVDLIANIVNIGESSGIRIIFAIISLLLNLSCCLIMLRLASTNDRYRVAGAFGIAAVVIAFIQDLLPETSWVTILSWVAAVPALIGEFQEYMAHAEQLDSVDSELAEKWRKLWYWYIGSLAVMLGSTILVFIAPFLTILVILAALITTVVVSVIKVVYLYRTARLFREYSGVMLG